MSPEEQTVRVDDMVGNGVYQVLRPLGEGAFGQTFLVEHRQLLRPSVLKVLPAGGAEAHRKLREEYDLLSRLDHPAFARVYDCGVLPDGRLYLISEYVPGRTLADLLRGGPLDVDAATTVARTLADGLGYLHQLGYVHRDIKPANILVAGNPPEWTRARLVDFGVFAQLYQAGSERLTMSGVFVGTPRYMAPEQLTALPQSPATDVYGLGLLLFEMLYGRLPHEDQTETVVALMTRILQTDPDIPDDPKVPPHLRRLLSRALSRDPALRPRNGALFAAGLDGDSATASYAVASARRSLNAALPAAPPPAPDARRMRASRQHLAAPKTFQSFTVATLAALAVLSGAVWLASARIQSGFIGGLGPPVAFVWIAVGVGFCAAGLLLGNVVRRIARSRLHDVEIDAERLLLGLNARRRLSDTIQVEVAAIIARCRDIDERILGITIMKMIDEYDAANASDQRQAALMNLATLLEKLRGRLSPWYARFERQLALATSALGIASGAVSVAAGVIKLLGER